MDFINYLSTNFGNFAKLAVSSITLFGLLIATARMIPINAVQISVFDLPEDKSNFKCYLSVISYIVYWMLIATAFILFILGYLLILYGLVKIVYWKCISNNIKYITFLILWILALIILFFLIIKIYNYIAKKKRDIFNLFKHTIRIILLIAVILAVVITISLFFFKKLDILQKIMSQANIIADYYLKRINDYGKYSIIFIIDMSVNLIINTLFFDRISCYLSKKLNIKFNLPSMENKIYNFYKKVINKIIPDFQTLVFILCGINFLVTIIIVCLCKTTIMKSLYICNLVIFLTLYMSTYKLNNDIKQKNKYNIICNNEEISKYDYINFGDYIIVYKNNYIRIMKKSDIKSFTCWPLSEEI